ncbi:response regulator [Planctomycetota bacterium]
MERRLQVLVVDDEPIVGKRLKSMLAKLGCDIEVFVDPKEACSRVDEREFDVVVTDILMAKLDGIQVLEHVLKRVPEAKVIMITGYAMMEMARQAMEKGAFDFIAKPFKPDDLRASVARAAAALGIQVESKTGESQG